MSAQVGPVADCMSISCLWCHTMLATSDELVAAESVRSEAFENVFCLVAAMLTDYTRLALATHAIVGIVAWAGYLFAEPIAVILAVASSIVIWNAFRPQPNGNSRLIFSGALVGFVIVGFFGRYDEVSSWLASGPWQPGVQAFVLLALTLLAPRPNPFAINDRSN